MAYSPYRHQAADQPSPVRNGKWDLGGSMARPNVAPPPGLSGGTKKKEKKRTWEQLLPITPFPPPHSEEAP